MNIFRLLGKLILLGCIFVLPLLQPPAAAVISPILAGAWLFYLTKKRFTLRLLAFFGGIILSLAYSVAMHLIVAPLAYEVSLPVWDWAPILVLVTLGTLASYVIFKKSPSGMKDFVKAHSAVWVLVPAVAAAIWFVMYHYVVPFVKGTNIGGEVWNTWVVVFVLVLAAVANFWLTGLATSKLSTGIRWDARVWVLVSALASVFWHTNTDPAIKEWQTAKSLNPEFIKELADTENNRILPRYTAYNFIQTANSSTIPLVASQPHILMQDGVLDWQSHFHVNVLWGQICDTVTRVVQIEADETTRNPHPHDTVIVCSSQSWLMQGTFKFRHPFAKQGTHIYWKDKQGNWLTLIPYTSKRPTVWGTMVPYLSGVMVVTPWGYVSDYSVDEANQAFPGAPFFPTDIARELVKTYGKWHGGFIGRGLTGAGALEISEDAEKDVKNQDAFMEELQNNKFPFLQKFQDRTNLQLVFALEPAYQNAQGLSEIVMFDAGTGKFRVWAVPGTPKSGKVIEYAGADAAADAIRQGDPGVGNWENSMSVEPRLVYKKGRGLYWLYGVISHGLKSQTDGSYVMSAIVNAQTLQAYPFRTIDQLNRFLELDSDPPATNYWNNLSQSPALPAK